MVGALFDLLHIPVVHNGTVFHLPGFTIEVARECSGINSTLAFLVLSLVIAKFYIRTWWKSVLFVGFGLLVMILKNAIRIVTLTLLAMYVNPDFLTGNLHRHGGIVFFLLGLLIMWPVFLALRPATFVKFAEGK